MKISGQIECEWHVLNVIDSPLQRNPWEEYRRESRAVVVLGPGPEFRRYTFPHSKSVMCWIEGDLRIQTNLGVVIFSRECWIGWIWRDPKPPFVR